MKKSRELAKGEKQHIVEKSRPSRPSGGRCRIRDLGLSPGFYTPGRCNAITDVDGVLVGHSTIVRGRGRLRPGRGPVRTGVTAVLPNGHDIFQQRVVGGGFILNGAGEMSGLTQVMEWGLIETPILLTNTLSVGTCSEAVVKYMVKAYPGIGQEHDVIIPLVGECDDSWLNDISGRHVKDENVFEAISTAVSGPVQEGNVGGGTGMITCDFAGGIGTASRKLPATEGGYMVGVLVMSNFGRMNDLRMDGLPVGQMLQPRFSKIKSRKSNYGSIIAVAATDAPLNSHQLNRICKRVGLGIGRAGSYAAHGSGEIIIGFSTANKVPRAAKNEPYWIRMLPDPLMDPLYRAVIEATEEAILNALCMSENARGVYDRLVPALPLEDVGEIIGQFRSLVPLARARRLQPKKTRTGPIHQVGGKQHRK